MKADGEADFLGVDDIAPSGGSLLRNCFESARLFEVFIYNSLDQLLNQVKN
jgi:hypothetical protein